MGMANVPRDIPSGDVPMGVMIERNLAKNIAKSPAEAKPIISEGTPAGDMIRGVPVKSKTYQKPKAETYRLLEKTETTPKAVGGKYADEKKTIARPIQDVGIEYGQQLPKDVYLHGSYYTGGDIEKISVSQKEGGTLFLTKDWDTAANYVGKEGGIKAIELNKNAKILDLSKNKDRKTLEKILESDETTEGQYSGISDELSDYDFHKWVILML